MGLFTRLHRIPPAVTSTQCLETHDHFPWPVPYIYVCMNVCVAVAESVRTGSVAAVTRTIIITTTYDCRLTFKTYTRRL